MSPHPRPSPSTPHADALAHARAGNRDEAVALIERRVNSSSNDADRAEGALALAEIASLAVAEGDLPAAERALGLALVLRADFADLQLRHGRLLVRLGRRSEAQE